MQPAGRSLLASDEVSLPLMGIGNRSPSRQTCVRILILITPHGDREPLTLALAIVQDFLLITPHGDREHAPRDWRESVICSSLPLMGIGNDLPDGRKADVRLTHYPSWGSGTGAQAGKRDPHPRHLITPHGDREPT